jgi:hypothetical protein
MELAVGQKERCLQKTWNGSSKGLIEKVVSGDLPCGRVVEWAAGYLRA